MKLLASRQILGRCVQLTRATTEPYWYHLDKSGNRCRHIVSVERITAREDGLQALCVTVGPWRVMIEG